MCHRTENLLGWIRCDSASYDVRPPDAPPTGRRVALDDLVARRSRLDDFDEAASRRLWLTVPRRGSGGRAKAQTFQSGPPACYGPEVELAAWIVDAVGSGNPRYPLRARSQQMVFEDAIYQLAGLGQEERAVVAAQHQGLSHSEIARTLGKKLGTVQATLSHAHRKLRALADLKAAA